MKYQVHVTWIPDGGFAVAAFDDRKQVIGAESLAFTLFSHDPSSWYGATIRTTLADGYPAIHLSPGEGLRLFQSSELWNSAATYEWPTFFGALQTMAKSISDALSTEGYVPDFEGYQQGQLKWKLKPGFAQDFVDGVIALKQENQLDDSAWGIETANAWLDACVQEEIGKAHGRSGSPPSLFALHPLLTMVPASAFHSEPEWLLALGYGEEGSHLDVLLEIADPEDETDSLSLKVWVQDGSTQDAVFPAPGFVDVAEDELPLLLRHQAATAVTVATRIWKLLVPMLEAKEGQEEPYGLRQDIEGDDAWDLLMDGVPRLTDAGYRVLVPVWWQDIAAKKPRFSARVTASGKSHSLFGMAQMVDFDWRIAIGDVDLSEDEFIALVSRKQRLLRIRNQWIALNPEVLQAFRRVTQWQGKGRQSTFREALEMMLTRGHRVEDGAAPTDTDPSVDIRFDGELEVLTSQLQTRESMPVLPTPAVFRGELRAYQQVGFSWLIFLRKYGLGGCLADDMGLGKTIQYTAYLLHSRGLGENHPQDGQWIEPTSPALLICPTSVLGNWQRELQRFAPEIRVYLHYGPNRAKDEGFEQAIRDCDVVLTSYTLCALDEDTLRTVTWDSICLDEAQNIKNPHTKQAMAVRRFDGYHRIAMTGTPMENRLTELWSIFEFINPGYLGRMSQFVERFARPIERDNDSTRVEQLQRLIAPFLLRRRKQDPDIDLALPDKLEQTVHVPLSRDQAALYESIVSDMLRKVDTLSAMERRGLILASLTRLKQACNHPALLQPAAPFRYAEGQSAKLDRLLEMMGELLSEGDKCLIFTQFIQTGHIIQASIETELEEASLFLHGGLSKTARDAMVADFQSSTGAKVLILSLKAGGVGLNLTSANHVFHFDRWWNPAVENQATDRAYRIGQTKHVLVHKFVSLGTLEERIDEMIQRKLAVSTQVVSAGEQWITELSTEELTDLFQLRQGMGLSEL